MQKKAEGASSHLKKIVSLFDQWSTALSSVAAVATELADEVHDFCKEDAYANLVATRFKEASLLWSHQTELLLKGSDHAFLPLQESLSTYNSLCAKKSKWWNKAEENVKPIEDWYSLRFDTFRLPLATFIGYQTVYFENLSNVWNALTDTLEDKNLTGLTENTTAKDIVSTVELLVSNPLSLQYFKKFLDQDLAAENLNFLLDVNAFMNRHKENRTTFEDFKTHATKIFDRYVANKSEQQVNLDYETVHSLKEKFNEMVTKNVRDDQLFADSKRAVLSLLASSVLPRFKASPLCQELYMTWRPVRAYNEDLLSNAKKPNALNIFVPDVPPPTEPSPSVAEDLPPSPRNMPRPPSPLSLPTSPIQTSSPLISSPLPASLSLPNSPSLPPSPRGGPSPPSPRSLPTDITIPTTLSTPNLRASSSPPKQRAMQRNMFSRSPASPASPVSSTPPGAASPPAALSQLSSQHRVKLVTSGPHNSPTPVFFQSRSSAVSVPRKSSSAGTLVESPPPQLLRTSTEDFVRVDRSKVPRRGTSAGAHIAHIHSPYSFQTIEKIFTDPSKEPERASILGSEGGGLVSSRSERSYHNRRDRSNTNVYAVVGRRRPNGSATSSPSTPHAGYDSDGDGYDFESRGSASRTGSSDSLHSSSESGERDRRMSRGSSLDSFDIIEKMHSRSNSNDSTSITGGERSEEDSGETALPAKDLEPAKEEPESAKEPVSNNIEEPEPEVKEPEPSTIEEPPKTSDPSMSDISTLPLPPPLDLPLEPPLDPSSLPPPPPLIPPVDE